MRQPTRTGTIDVPTVTQESYCRSRVRSAGTGTPGPPPTPSRPVGPTEGPVQGCRCVLGPPDARLRSAELRRGPRGPDRVGPPDNKFREKEEVGPGTSGYSGSGGEREVGDRRTLDYLVSPTVDLVSLLYGSR